MLSRRSRSAVVSRPSELGSYLESCRGVLGDRHPVLPIGRDGRVTGIVFAAPARAARFNLAVCMTAFLPHGRLVSVSYDDSCGPEGLVASAQHVLADPGEFAGEGDALGQIALLAMIRDRFSTRPCGPVDEALRGMWSNVGMYAEHVAPEECLMRALVPADVDDPMRRDVALEACRMHLVPTVEAFLGTLDPGAVSFLADLARARWREWGRLRAWLDDGCWEGLDARRTPGAPLRALIQAHPALADVACDAWRRNRAAFAGPTTDLRAVASPDFFPVPPSRAVWDACLARAAVAPGTTRPPTPDAGLSHHVFEDRRVTRATARIAVLCRLPDSWIPTCDAEWDAFDAALPVVAHGDATLRQGLDLASFVNARGRWGACGMRLGAACRSPGGPSLDACVAVTNVARAFARQVVIPAVHVANGTPPAEAAVTQDLLDRAMDVSETLLFEGLSLARLLETSTRWHQGVDGSAAATMLLPASVLHEVRWDALLPDRSYGDVTVTVPTSAAELVAEGGRGDDVDGVGGLSHCVAGYVDECLKDEVRMLSLRRSSGGGTVRLSTAQVRISGPDAPHLVQHKGRRNEVPPADAQLALRAYLSDVRNGGLAAVPAVPRQPRDTFLGAGYDWSRPGAVDAVLEAWRPHLPRRHRTLGPLDVAARTGDALHLTVRLRLLLPEGIREAVARFSGAGGRR